MPIEIEDVNGVPSEEEIQAAMKSPQWPEITTDGPINYTGIFLVTLAASFVAHILFWLFVYSELFR